MYELADDPTLLAGGAQGQGRRPLHQLRAPPERGGAAAAKRRGVPEGGRARKACRPQARSARNAAFIGLERKLTRAEGLPGRPWFTHQVYAPGFYTGYGVKTLPAIREALEQRQWAQATQQIEVVARTLDAFSAELERLTTP